MGTSFTYKCNKCGYHVQTSGKLDCGFFAVTDTYICQACKEIVDVAVGVHGKKYTKGEVHKQQLGAGTDMDDDFYTCPECGSDQQLVKWNKKRKPCPRCDGKMKIDPEGEMILWD